MVVVTSAGDMLQDQHADEDQLSDVERDEHVEDHDVPEDVVDQEDFGIMDESGLELFDEDTDSEHDEDDAAFADGPEPAGHAGRVLYCTKIKIEIQYSTVLYCILYCSALMLYDAVCTVLYCNYLQYCSAVPCICCSYLLY